MKEEHRLDQIAAALPGYDAQALRVELAQAAIARLLAPLAARLGNETLPLREALGRCLAAELVSPLDVPAFDNSAMDGYALAAASLQTEGTPTRLAIAGRSLAGQGPAAALQPGHCLRIMTGAPMPPGADTVVPQELVTRPDEASILIPPGLLRPGANRRRAGEDLARGQGALRAGQRLRAAEIGLLASLGLAEVTVRRRPRVALLSTGDELCPPGRPLPPGGVYDSNRHTLWSLLQALPVEVLDLGPVRDDPAALRAAFAEAAARADVVLSTGGVGVGEADHTKRVMAELGEVLFWQLAMRPGRPLAVGRIGSEAAGRALLLGLPGNPVAVMVGFYAFVRPALLALAGTDPAPPLALRARSAEPLRKRAGRTEYQRGIVERGEDGDWWVRSTGSQGSGILSSMSRANGLILLAHERGEVARGDWVEVLPFEGLN
ncbi:molybdopterin molybdotransferase MoeA [Roseateles sp. DAIF2]|uniref:molybdopterin molybdotransferase MoeA n=1 Tax=Roseateles sp. DAIF2 TaxID=2714952 RepID=UPI0018A30E11|nr:gephyrin-like molybdotransferase Glp [Roseateles sp. DAIF2]QPF74754.1 molybdopterin molybdotransferase MoeA [Roseateles sp. DAIF2]